MVIASRLRTLSPRAILAIGWCVFAIHAYPGLMSNDAVVQLHAARSRQLSSMTVALWSALDQIVAGPFGLIVVQSLMVVGGAYLIARRVVTPRRAACVAIATLLFPPVLAGMSIPSGFGLFAGAALLGVALLLDERPRVRAIGCLALALAVATRETGVVAILPLVGLFASRLPGPRWRQFGIGVAVWGAIVLASWGASAVVLDRDVSATQPHDRPLATRAAQREDDLRALEIPTGHSKVQAASDRVVSVLAETPLFSPWVYLALALALLIVLRACPTVVAVLASGVVAQLAELVVAAEADYLRSHWLVGCAVFAALAAALRKRPV